MNIIYFAYLGNKIQTQNVLEQINTSIKCVKNLWDVKKTDIKYK